jgi:DNA helicase HerA-like ATPase
MRTTSGESVVLGETTFRGVARPIRLTRGDRLRHVYIVGKTGTGKSTLLRQLAEQDMKAGTGFAFIDPHGDVAADLARCAARVPGNRVVYLDCSGPRPGWSLNVFSDVAPERRGLVACSPLVFLRHPVAEV